MSHAFLTSRPSRRSGLILPVLLFLLMAVVIVAGLDSVGASAETEQLAMAEQALTRAAVQCYALEGRYPDNLEYLAEQYGVVLDRQRYVYHYQPIGANIMPQISVFAR